MDNVGKLGWQWLAVHLQNRYSAMLFQIDVGSSYHCIEEMHGDHELADIEMVITVDVRELPAGRLTMQNIKTHVSCVALD